MATAQGGEQTEERAGGLDAREPGRTATEAEGGERTVSGPEAPRTASHAEGDRDTVDASLEQDRSA